MHTHITCIKNDDETKAKMKTVSIQYQHLVYDKSIISMITNVEVTGALINC